MTQQLSPVLDLLHSNSGALPRLEHNSISQFFSFSSNLSKVLVQKPHQQTQAHAVCGMPQDFVLLPLIARWYQITYVGIHQSDYPLTLCKGTLTSQWSQPLRWVSPCEMHPKDFLNLRESVKLFSIRVLRLVGGCLLLYSSPDTSAILSFLEAGQQLSLLFYVLQYVFFSCCGEYKEQLKLEIKMLIDLSY